MIKVSTEEQARIAAFRKSLVQHDYHPVAVETGGKAPLSKDWRNLSPVITVDTRQANTGLLAGSISVIDIDIEDRETVSAIVEHCTQEVGEPMVRSRGDSERVALIYRSSDPNRKKSKISTRNGDIEILGLGQQLVVDGVHPGGSRYQLSDLIAFEQLPELNDIQIARLGRTFSLGGTASQPKSDFAEGSRNDSLYHFGIQHAGGRTYEELFDLLVNKNQTACSVPLDENEVANITFSVYQSDANKSKGPTPQDLERNEKGKLLSTRNNFEKIMEHNEYRPVFNAITKNYELLCTTDTRREFIHGERAFAVIVDQLAKLGLPKTMAENYFAASCLDHEINPVKDWIESSPWDGLDRIVDLYSSLGVDESTDTDLGIELLTKWLVTGIRSAFGTKGVAAQGVLVLQGPQNIGKTTWLKRLLNGGPDVFLEGAVLQPDNKDSVLRVIGHWIVELGELDATFRKADLSKLKAFITSTTDDLRRPYGRAVEKIQRRTIFCGSVNTSDFLTDETGNRRYWILPVTDRLNIDHGLDMQQIWAQAYSLYKDKHPINLSPSECNEVDLHNRQFERKGVLDAILQRAYSWDTDPAGWYDWKSTGEILLELGARTEDGTKNTAKLGLALKALEVEKKRTKRGMRYLMPPVDYSQLRLLCS